LSIRFRMQEHTSAWNVQISYGAQQTSYKMGIEGEGNRSLKLTTHPN
jgi:hypothetical protein